MSEYQYIEFRAVDRPLTDNELAFANNQSSRAEVSRWRFTNEYNYGQFRGDVDGMLRQGYDVFLEYANYGTRTIKIRLPGGLPFKINFSSKFVDEDFLKWRPDPNGNAGTLILEPFLEAFDQFWDFDDCLNDVIAIRQRLIAGDARALYLLWLCVAGDQNYDWSAMAEPPVPFGLQDFDLKLNDLFHFFDVDPLLVTAATNDPALQGTSRTEISTPVILTPEERLKPWLNSLSQKQAKHHLQQLLVGDATAVKAEILSAIAQDCASSNNVDWPSVELNRTFEQLLKRTEVLRETFENEEKEKQAANAKRAAIKAQIERENRMAEMAMDPQKWLAKTERLADERGKANYQLAAAILAELKEAIGGEKGAALARNHAAHLARKHPTLNLLKSSLKKQGVWG